MKLIHTMPLFIHKNPHEFESNLKLAKRCFESLAQSKENRIVVYNQGCLPNEVITNMLKSYGVSPIILGNGSNVGIPKARQTCFQYIWDQYPEIEFISEVHLDMIFPKNWYTPLIDFLSKSDEPMVSPGILTISGEMQPLGNFVEIPEDTSELISLLAKWVRDEVHERFVHPVIHKSQILKEVGGYDTQFLKGKQGYEDDSLLLGYLYYMGTRTNWRPKCYLKSFVYHAGMAQRMSLPDKSIDFDLNEKGLIKQYGAYGLKQLSHIHENSSSFKLILDKFMEE